MLIRPNNIYFSVRDVITKPLGIRTLTASMAEQLKEALRLFILLVVFCDQRVAHYARPTFAFLEITVKRAVPVVSADVLGAARALVCLVALTNAVWENLPNTARLGSGLRASMGLFDVVQGLPGADAIFRSETALLAVQGATILALALAMFGVATRYSVPCAASLYFVFEGALRAAVGTFWHTGALAVVLLFALCFMPTGDGASDKAGSPSRAYGLPLWVLWGLVAAFYAMAGASKLRNGGLDWFDPNNLRGIILTDNLAPMEFHWQFGLWVLQAPDSLLTAAAICTVIIELAFPLVLISRGARWIFPVLAVGMHLGIWLLQRILFVDLMLLQGLFYLPLLQLRRRAPASPPDESRAFNRSIHRLAVPAVVLVFVSLAANWRARGAAFPFDDVSMYSYANNSGVISYVQAEAIYADGSRGRAPIEAAFPCLRDSRFRFVLEKHFAGRTGERAACQQMLDETIAQWNRQAHAGRKIRAIEVQKVRIDYLKQPN